MTSKMNQKRSHMAFEGRRLEHVRLRLRQRYDLDIDLAEMRALNRLIADGGGENRGDANDGSFGVWTFFKGKWVYWMYLVGDRCITTAYPVPPTNAPAFIPEFPQVPDLAPDLERAQAEVAQLRAELGQRTAQNNLLANQEMDARFKLEKLKTAHEALRLAKVEPIKVIEAQLTDARQQIGNMGSELAVMRRKVNASRYNWTRVQETLACFDRILGQTGTIQAGSPKWARMRSMVRSLAGFPYDSEIQEWSDVVSKEAELYERWHKPQPPTDEPNHAPEIW